MKKADIITIHVGSNFGSILQAIATFVTFRKLNVEPVIINYIPDRVTYAYYWQSSFKSIISLFKRTLMFPNFVANKIIYGKYLRRHVRLSSAIYSKDDFVKKCPKADYYITGSDQVWNSKHNQCLNTRYFYDGINGIKIAYASSFGVEELGKNEYLKMQHFLSGYKTISVREDSAVKIIKSMGMNATHLLDPTFMLSKAEWTSYIKKRVINEDYLLIYTPYNVVDKDCIFSFARHIARQKGLKIVTFSWTYFIDKDADITIRYADPGKFLSLMEYADYVITNSFHGTAFSINLNKQFSVFMPNAFSTRIDSILKLCRLERRLVSTNWKLENTYTDFIDYQKINNFLLKERIKAINFLKDSLS